MQHASGDVNTTMHMQANADTGDQGIA
jgi:hypothetical protein